MSSGVTREVLQRQFENFPWPIVESDDGGIFTDSGRSACECTAYAEHVRNVLGAERVAVVGFFESENPDSEVARDCGGHDFALVDGRFVVDPWLRAVDGRSQAIAFDTALESDRETIARLYGRRETWKPLKGLGQVQQAPAAPLPIVRADSSKARGSR